VRSSLFLASLFATASLYAAVDDAPKKRGGFIGVTPKPVVKKSASGETTAKKPTAAADEDSDQPEKRPVTKKTTSESTTKKRATTSDDETREAPMKKSSAADATPAPKKKAKQPEESPAEEKKTPPADATAKTPKTYDAESNGTTPVKREHAPAATVAAEDIAEFSVQSPKAKELILAALELTKLNLSYTYGSADPAQGGMDCSGAMYHLLRSQGFKDVPRDSSSQYVWARKAGPFFSVVSKSAESFEFRDLQPGDLLFWTGTYETGREIPISHVMLYLGTEKKTKKRIMFGSSDGRSYNGVQRWGVSVFDFKMPKADPANPEKAKVDFVGYGRIPALREEGSVGSQIAVEKPILETKGAEVAAEKRSAVPKKKRSSAKRTGS